MGLEKLGEVTLTDASHLLRVAGIEDDVLSLDLHNAGGNNRIFRVETSGNFYALKQYFKHEDDQRDRMGAEFAFLKYANRVVPGYVPIAFSRDVDKRIALYEFVHGRKIGTGDVRQDDVRAATSFLQGLNSKLDTETTVDLPNASEACFSLSDHMAVIDHRIDQLKAIKLNLQVDKEGLEFTKELDSMWQGLKGQIIEAATVSGWSLGARLGNRERCISPSDFGFHNALRKESGELCFIDFEYAGWDDPAKTVGDFFSQLAVPVPSEYFAQFVQELAVAVENPDIFALRAHTLRPLYQIKWCCIALNIFLPVNMARRKFANPALDEGLLKQQQLVKAKRLLANIIREPYGLH